jgi:hypothetical protein
VCYLLILYGGQLALSVWWITYTPMTPA